MKKAILARKVGMTQIFNEAGELVPVTVQRKTCQQTCKGNVWQGRRILQEICKRI